MRLVTIIAQPLALFCLLIGLPSESMGDETQTESLRNANPLVLAYEDPYGQLSVNQLFELQETVFTPREDTHVGYTNSDWWLHIKLVNDDAEATKRYIVLPIMSSAPVYAYDWVDGQLRERIAGADRAKVSDIDQSHVLAFDYLISPGEQRSVLIRQTPGINPMRLDFTIQTESQFLRTLNIESAKLFIPLAILSVLLLLNLFYWITSRDSAFGFYSGYLTAVMLIPIARFGGTVYINFPANLEASLLVIGGGLGYVFFALMLRTLFNDIRTRLVNYMCFGLVIPIGLGVPAIALFNPITAMKIYTEGAGLVLLSGLSIILASALLQRHRLSTYLAVGYFALLVGSVLAVLQFRGILGPEFNGVILGGVIVESLIFTFALASRFQLELQAQKILAENREKLQRTAQLALLGEMAASISHELKQPLNAIKLVTHNIKQLVTKSPESVVERLPNKLERILSLVDRASEIANHVRRSSRLSTGETEAADVSKSILGCRLMLDPQLAMENIELLCDLPDNLPKAAIHPLRLDQVVLNLLGNAKDVLSGANDAAKWIKVEARCTGEKDLELCITDSGGGIPADVLPRIFDQFFTTKNAEEGTGLGLFICKTIIEDAGGSIVVVNTIDGARFCITLPTTE